MSDSITPVLVGVAQVAQRTKDLTVAKEPVELMFEALHNAAQDTGNPSILRHVESVRVSQGQWQYENPAKYLASQLELPNIETGKTVFGGNGVQTTVNLSALDIQRGKFKVIAMTGAECGYSQAQARKSGQTLHWKTLPGTPDWTIEYGIGRRDPALSSLGIGGASQMYAIVENAIRHSQGETIDEHQKSISELWSRFNDVAQTNPSAWIQHEVSAEEIRTEGPQNRPIAFPYPKLMNANNNVDQGAALLMCSVETAKKLSIPEGKWIYPWAGTDAHDTQVLSERAQLVSAPGLRKAAERVLALTQANLSAIAYFDLYSCFPSAVQVAAKEIGLDLEQQLTVTGGLTFGGGPLNNYVMHAIARMVEILREDQGKLGMITANGGILTKHAHGTYSSAAPPRPFQYEDVQDQVDSSHDRVGEPKPRGTATIEGYTVVHSRDAPVRGIVACLTEEGKRAWAVTEDRAIMLDMRTQEYGGRQVQLTQDGRMRAVN
ncbi:MAG: acetyl-CoA acetyltransferase [Gammaproteobacteria bacterium]|nr:acetyl-CoA acetyltransferase [Gammaproteobacteria bacterium]